MSAEPSSSGPGTSGVADVEPDRVAQVFDLVSYVALMLGLFGGASAVVSLALGASVDTGVKYGLFIFGWVALLFGTLKLRPKSAWKSDDDGLLSMADEGGMESDFQRWVQQVPPARFRQVPPGGRLSTGTRLFIASVCMLAVSFLLERALGVPG
jgi:hypothetical protein